MAQYCRHCPVPSVEQRKLLHGDTAELEITVRSVNLTNLQIRVIPSDTILTIKGLIEDYEGTPRLHMLIIVAGRRRCEGDTLESMWSDLERFRTMVGTVPRVNGYARTRREGTSRVREKEQRRLNQRAELAGQSAAAKRWSGTRLHIYTPEEWTAIDEEYWEVEELRRANERLQELRVELLEEARGDIARQHLLFPRMLDDEYLSELHQRWCRHRRVQVFHETMLLIIGSNVLNDGDNERNVRRRLHY
jgi:hypothetical protein